MFDFKAPALNLLYQFQSMSPFKRPFLALPPHVMHAFAPKRLY